MARDSDSKEAVASYICAPSLFLLLLFVGPLLAIVGADYWKEAPATSEAISLLIASLAITSAGVFFLLTTLRSVEVKAAGTVEFVSRIRRDVYPLAILAQIKAETRMGSRVGGSGRLLKVHRAEFVFRDNPAREVIRWIEPRTKEDEALQEFVRQIERLNPNVDTSAFWVWSRS